MKFEKIKIINKNKIIIGGLIGLGVISAICVLPSFAKYKLTESINIANGTVNYKVPDFKVMAMYQQNESGDYEETTAMPSTGYIINEEKSYCNLNGTLDNEVKLKTIDGNHTIANLIKGDKCYLYFDFPHTITELLSSLKKDDSRSGIIEGIFDSSTPDTIYSKEDNFGISYLFAGKNPNNWVKYAGFYWRIIRINGNGTIRIIYNGVNTTQTGETTQIGLSAYNSYEGFNYDNVYVGYMYGKVKASNYKDAFANTNSSTIKKAIDEWYDTNIKANNYEDKIDKSVGFCGDRTPYVYIDGIPTSGGGYGVANTSYGASIRIKNKMPSLICNNKDDYYTVENHNFGNNALSNPVGLITVDEALLAGASPSIANKEYYLYTGNLYWTMSPSSFNSQGAPAVYPIYSDGRLYYKDQYVTARLGVRPVINLRSDITFSSGDGTLNNPYIVN